MSRRRLRSFGRSFRPTLEGLESRLVPAMLTINTTLDVVDADPNDGVCDIDLSTPGNQISLRAAIQFANSHPDADTIILPAGIYRLTLPGRFEDAAASGDLNILGTLTLQGAGSASTIIDAHGLGDRVFQVNAGIGVTVDISGLTITGGRLGKGDAGAGIWNRDTTLTLTGVRIVDNQVAENGAGDLLTVAIAVGTGGGIYQEDAPAATSLHLIDSIVESNSASHGGGIYGDGNVELIRTLVRDNQAAVGGGIAFVGLDFNLSLRDSTIERNRATLGAGLYKAAGQAEISGSTISNNEASSTGGGIAAYGGLLHIENSTLSGNRAILGGAVSIGGPGSSLLLISSTVTSNQAETAGGLSVAADGTVRVTNTILAGNTAMAFGQTFSRPSDFNGAGEGGSGLILSSGHNLIGTRDGEDGARAAMLTPVASDLLGTFAQPLDLRLGPLQDNGGPTFSHALLVGSPAIDAGDNVVVPGSDQRGILRPQGLQVDIGAFELTPTSTAALSGTVFEDRGGNGERDAGEPGLGGWTIYLDQNDNDRFDLGERSTTTDSVGNYRFDDLAAGTYIVRELQQPGSRQTSPAGVTERVSVPNSGGQASSHSSTPAVSADGRFVAFASLADNLVPGDTNGDSDVFVYDRQTRVTQRVSVSSLGAQANGASRNPSLSGDGQVVVFESLASNLVPGDRNNAWDIFAYDRSTGVLQRLTEHVVTGHEANDDSFAPALSADGRYVAFESSASNLVPGDTNGASDIFVADLRTGLIERVSVNDAGVQGADHSHAPALSADGRYVVFASYAANLVVGDTNNQLDVFLHDRLTHRTRRISVSAEGEQGNGASFDPSLSADGRFVAFTSQASNLVPRDGNSQADIFLVDRQAGTIDLVSANPVGDPGNGTSLTPAVSADGNWVAFTSFADNLVGGDANGRPDVFLYERFSKAVWRVSEAALGASANERSTDPVLTANGRFVAWGSFASNLLPEDTNAAADIFVREMAGAHRISITGQESTDLLIEAAFGPATVDFGNQFLLSRFQGQEFEDVNHNGVHDAGELGRNDLFVELVEAASGQRVDFQATHDVDLNGDGIIDPLTERGLYQFVVVRGRYVVREFRRFYQELELQTTPPGQTEQISVHLGDPGFQPSSDPSISDDGRFVAFVSTADDLVSDDTNYEYEIFVRDRLTGVTERVSLDSQGQPAKGGSYEPAISGDGRFVVFESIAALVAEDTNGLFDIYLFDRQTHTVQRVSVSASGIQANADCRQPAITGDGRLIAFQSAASNLLPGTNNSFQDIFVLDRQTGLLDRVSVSNSGAEANKDSRGPSISDEGRFVAFLSPATNLVSTGSSISGDAFVFDRQTRTIERVTVDNAGNPGAAFASVVISGNGQLVAYDSFAANLLPGDTNNRSDIFVFDRTTHQVDRISVDSQGEEANGSSFLPSLSDDGRYVAFVSDASNLVPGDANNVRDVFVFDRLTRTLQRVSQSSAGLAFSAASNLAVLSGNGQVVVFESAASNLDPAAPAFRTEVLAHELFGVQVVAAATAGSVTGFDFGNYFQTTSFTGQKVEDRDGDGFRETGDPGVDGWTIELVDFSHGFVVVATQVTHSIDVNGDGIINPETERGYYRFENLAPDIFYLIREVDQPGWNPTAATSSRFAYFLPRGSAIVGQDFLSFRPITISGQVFEDDGGQLGVRDANDPGLPGLTLFLDANNNGKLDSGEISTTSDSTGRYSFTGLKPGTYIVSEVADDYMLTVPATGSYTVTRLSGQSATGLDFAHAFELNESLEFLFVTDEDRPATVNVLANAPNPRQLPLQIISISTPAHGAVVLNADQTLTYTPQTNYFGGDSFVFHYRRGNGVLRAGIVTFDVNSVNDAPTLDAMTNRSLTEDAATFIEVPLTGISTGAANENQTLTVTATSSNPAAVPGIDVSYTQGATGSIKVFLTANANTTANGPVTITVTVTVTDNGDTLRGGIRSVQRQFTVTVTPVNDPPVLTVSTLPAGYNRSSTGVVLDPNFALSDVDTTNFNGATLDIRFSPVVDGTLDRLFFSADTSGIGGSFVLVGGQVRFLSAGATLTTIGTFTGGTTSGTNGNTPLVITLNSQASVVMVQNLLRSVRYGNLFATPGVEPILTDRQIRFTLTESDGVTQGTVTRTVIWDQDGDGVRDSEEGTLDRNGDGIPDSTQANVATFANGVNGTKVTLVAPAGTAFQDLHTVPNPSPGNVPAGATFPFGFFDYRLTGLTPGAARTVTIILPAGTARPSSYFKYGPTPDNKTPHWYNFAFNGTTGATFPTATNRILLNFVDGQRGDDDLTANGTIVDPGAPALEPPPQLAPDERFVNQVYRDLLGRDAEPAGLLAWKNELEAGRSRSQIVQAITGSREYHSLRVGEMYVSFLSRVVEPAGLASWLSFLRLGGTLEQVATRILGSPEYAQTHGATTASFLDALYRDVLGRPPDAFGAAAFSDALTHSVTRQHIAEIIFASTEYQEQLTQRFYSSFLGRAAEPAGLSFWTNQLRHDLAQESLLAGILGSQEYAQRL